MRNFATKSNNLLVRKLIKVQDKAVRLINFQPYNDLAGTL